MAQAANLTCIVPVCAEWDNGCLPRLLHSLARQSVPLEAVLVVNNTPLDRQLQTRRWEDNRSLLDFLSGLEGKKNPTEPHNTELATTLGASSLTIHTIDLSEGTERNMGQIRNQGLQFALQHHPGDEHIITFLDSDCVVAEEYGAGLCAAFSGGTDFLALPMIYFPLDGEETVCRSFYRHHLPLLHQEVLRHLSGAPPARLGGPQLAASPSAWKRLGSFPALPEGEDFAAGRELARLCGITHGSDPRLLVVTADRAYDNGFEAAARQSGLRFAGSGESGPMLDNPVAVILAAATENGQTIQTRDLLTKYFHDKRTLQEQVHAASDERDVYRQLHAAGVPLQLEDLEAGCALLKDVIGLVVPAAEDLAATLVHPLEKLLSHLENEAAARAGSGLRHWLWPTTRARQNFLNLCVWQLAIPAVLSARTNGQQNAVAGAHHETRR